MIIDQSVLENVLNAALAEGADFAEVYAEDTYDSRLSLMDSRISGSQVSQLYGAGIRLFYGLEVIYTYTNDMSEEGLLNAARQAASAKKAGPAVGTQPLQESVTENIHGFGIKPWEHEKTQKIGYLKRFDDVARGLSSLVTQAEGTLIEKHKKVHIANSKGINTYEERNYTQGSFLAYVEENGERSYGRTRIGRFATSEYLDEVDYQGLAKQSVDQALVTLRADYAPAGEMPVVINKAFGGVIFHEACGHGLETTHIAKGASVFCGKLGEKVAESCVTAIDDGTIPNQYGSICFDDEGYPTQKTTLIENGILKSYLADQMGSLRTGHNPTGSGRRQDYRFAPTSRMRNTYIAAGDSSLEEIIKDVDYGLFAKNLGGGSVSPGTGDYNFAVLEGYMIKNGQIDKPVKGASLIGRGIETLGRIVKVGNDMELDAGTCGSVSGWVPVTVGQPPILVSKMVVGGRS